MESGKAESSATFGGNVRRVRESRGISQEELARMVNVHRTYMGSLERGKHSPSLWTIVRISRALDVLASDLIDGVV